ncbi:MAG: 50S ribosomal protein L10 [Pseudodesulfovibrio sp.]|uniref:Large ribosomal subunit protein uL10 n=1 Tax=Pseudodesulfovibrio aespoeensis (strain ATCC 700646 / DSM 10631 / Aspo-2) TaxID=643562 RepID=E6VTA9_PSEA9|nr:MULTISPECIES: 50S ribosomal protein L10 [Pseudodesulfovibrio]MBU4379252.1 50S ribosomal protein L10 [Pseudomonadota bacterium]ADU63268.1 ribosomal protein L10 [Pseudodesulfovibrio aespoeensis Aspo-2]MBU4475165.1 50S ribosomal protein L10 [Pseudomonadota bacterium]MBU4516161.1 50S ribosomal protein L10 [Pseudomonadota bacterium]MBU4523532.1 50S ribosomal protein L10 [Pseudomonadota bacterium]
MNRQEKAQIIEQLHKKAARASIAVVTDFKGLTVEEITQLRAKCYEVGVDYQVVKNTLARLALKDTDHGELSEHLKENCAIALGYDDPVALAKTLAEFDRTNKKFALRFGSLEGDFLDSDGVKELAKMPSKPELLSSVLGTMQAVPRNFVCLFANIERKFLYALTAIKEQKEAA